MHRSSEQELRRQLIEDRAVDVMVAVGPNMFYTVTLAGDALVSGSRARRKHRAPTRSCFIDARHTSTGRLIAPTETGRKRQLGFIANVVRLYRGEHLDFTLGGDEAQARIIKRSSARSRSLSMCSVSAEAATVKEISRHRGGRSTPVVMWASHPGEVSERRRLQGHNSKR